MSGLVQSLKDGARKAVVTAAIGTTISYIALGGAQPVHFMGATMPKAVVQGLSMGASQYVAAVVLPRITPILSRGNPALIRWEGMVLEPLVVGSSIVLLESMMAPGALATSGGAFQALVGGAGSQIASFYMADKLGWISS